MKISSSLVRKCIGDNLTKKNNNHVLSISKPHYIHETRNEVNIKKYKKFQVKRNLFERDKHSQTEKDNHTLSISNTLPNLAKHMKTKTQISIHSNEIHLRRTHIRKTNNYTFSHLESIPKPQQNER